MLEVWPHLDDNEVTSALLLLEGTVDFRNEVEVFKTEDCLDVQVADLTGVEDGIIEVEDDHGLVVAEQAFDVHLFVLSKGTTSHQDAAGL